MSRTVTAPSFNLTLREQDCWVEISETLTVSKLVVYEDADSDRIDIHLMCAFKDIEFSCRRLSRYVGKAVKVATGYEGVNETIAQGVIFSLSSDVSPNDEARLTQFILRASRFPSFGQPQEDRNHVYEHKTVSAVATMVAERLGLPIRLNAEKAKAETVHERLTQTTNDLAFLHQCARKQGYIRLLEPFTPKVESDKQPQKGGKKVMVESNSGFRLYFGPPEAASDVTVTWGVDLTSLKTETNARITMAQNTVAPPQSVSIPSAPQASTATQTIRRVETTVVQIEGQCPGNPKLRVGSALQIKGFSPIAVDGWRVTAITQTIGSEGYTTGFAASRIG